MRVARRVREPYAWLGVGALTLGIGAALAGAGVASADSTPSEGSASSASSASSSARSAGSASRGDAARPARVRSAAVRTATAVANASSTAPASSAVPAGAATASAARSTDTVSSKIRLGTAPNAAALSNNFTPPAAPWKPGSLVQAAFQHGVLLHALQGQVLGYQPTAQASQFASSGVDVAPTVAGMINAHAEGQPLEYTVTAEPLNGTVTIADDGSFIYTPDPAFLAVGGTDQVEVKVTNTARTLLNLLGAPRLSSDVTVPVTMAAAAPGYSPLGQPTPEVPFTIWNQSHHPVVIDYYEYNSSGAYIMSGPALKTVINPAGTSGSSATWVLQEVGEQNQLFINLTAPGLSWWVSFSTKPSNASGHDLARCGDTTGGSQCATDGYITAYLMDPAGTNVYVDSSDAQQQSDYLFNLCDGSFSNCRYDYLSSDYKVAYTQPVKPNGFSVAGNDSPVQTWKQITTTETTAYTTAVTDSYTVSASASTDQLQVMTATVGGAYTKATGYSIMTTSLYTQTDNYYTPAYNYLFLYAETPNLLQWGDWTVSYGATTYHLKNVWFMSPDGNGQAVVVNYTCLQGTSECDAALAGYLQNPVIAPASVQKFLPTPAVVLQ